MHERETFDVAVVCALDLPELAKLREANRGGVPWNKVPPVASDPTVYQSTVFQSSGGKKIRVVAAASPHMGMAASAVLATKMILRFSPRLVGMVGIAAGVKRETQGFGDILAPSVTVDYESGKLRAVGGASQFDPDPNPIHVAAPLLSRLNYWKTKRPELDRIRNGWVANAPSNVINLHVGPLGSGGAVVDDPQVSEDVRRHWRKLIGLEMEAYGVALACRDAVSPSPDYLCVKSICDFAADKNDDWQFYAAYTAAQFFHDFLVEEWDGLYPGTSTNPS